MIVLGDLSAIQNYLFDVSDSGGGQARRLRARSFVLQVIPDLAAIRIARELGWGFESLRGIYEEIGNIRTRLSRNGREVESFSSATAVEQRGRFVTLPPW